MKKFALATILTMAAFGASAASVTAEYNNANGVDGSANQQGYNSLSKEMLVKVSMLMLVSKLAVTTALAELAANA